MPKTKTITSTLRGSQSSRTQARYIAAKEDLGVLSIHLERFNKHRREKRDAAYSLSCRCGALRYTGTTSCCTNELSCYIDEFHVAVPIGGNNEVTDTAARERAIDHLQL